MNKASGGDRIPAGLFQILKDDAVKLLHAYNVVSGASLVAQRVKHLPAMQETWVQSLGQEDPLEKEIATHSSTLTWKNPMDREAW